MSPSRANRHSEPTLRYESEAQEVVDDSHLATGPWPKGIPFIKGLIPYRSAQFTQEIAVTNGLDRISPVHRTWLEKKWQVPGGTEHVQGWKSDLYKYIPEGGMTWVGDIDVWNGSNFQKNRGHKRSYPDGTIFIDVLSKDGNVFEKRIREKNNGKWESYVSFKDQKQRPAGYHGLKQSCVSCHSEAGTGGYATGLVPGGDFTISDPLPFE